MRLIRPLSSLAFVCLAGCGHAPLSTPATPKPPAGSYLDLEPGWRLRVITPLLTGGGYQLKTEAVHAQGTTLTRKASADFAGYETAYYDVRPQAQLRFTAAEVVRDGQRLDADRPVRPIFQPKNGMTALRIVYLKRGAATIHDMAILAAATPAALDTLTNAVQSTPETACRPARRTTCQWVPAGIAVRAETQKSGEWLPAR